MGKPSTSLLYTLHSESLTELTSHPLNTRDPSRWRGTCHLYYFRGPLSRTLGVTNVTCRRVLSVYGPVVVYLTPLS